MKHLDYLLPLIKKARNGVNTLTQIQAHLDENLDGVCEELSSRWLLSVCDTYVDWSECAAERMMALSLVIFVNMDKLACTWGYIYNIPEEVDENRLREVKRGKDVKLWSGIELFRLRNDSDMTDNMFRRMRKNLNPQFLTIFRALKEKMKEDRNMMGDINKIRKVL